MAWIWNNKQKSFMMWLLVIITNGLRANTVKCGCGHSMVLYVALELGCNKTYFGGLAPIVRGT